MKRIGLVLFMILTLGAIAYAQDEETLTLLTYYPAPYGVYNRLQVGSFYPSQWQSDISNHRHAVLTHNAYWNEATSTYRYNVTHGSFGTRMITFQYTGTDSPTAPGQGIHFFEVAGATTANTNITWGDPKLSIMADRVIFDDSVNVGIGTINPVSMLQIQRSLTHSFPTPGQTTGSIHIEPNTTTDNDSSSITFGATDDDATQARAQAGIYVQSDGSYGTKMYFGTTNSYATGSQSRMMIDHVGYVGIGNSNPEYPLSVNGGIEIVRLPTYTDGLVLRYDAGHGYIWSNGNTRFPDTVQIGRFTGGLEGWMTMEWDYLTQYSVISSTGNGIRSASRVSLRDLRIIGESWDSYIQLRQDTTKGLIKTNAGNLELEAASGDNDVYIDNSDLVCDEDLEVDGHIYVNGTQVHDIAEPFELINRDKIQTGDVVVINPQGDGKLELCHKENDFNVAGIISSERNAGMIIGKRYDGTNDKPLAIAGRVYCKVDADFDEIKPGDLLVTSPTPGYVMKAKPIGEINGYPIYPQGCIVGKALEPLKEGKGKILVLVCLM